MKESDLTRLLIKLAAAAVVTAAALLFAVGFIPQHGNEMFPSVKDGDLVVTLKAGCSYQTGTLCAYRDPEGSVRLGRIAAMPGEEVDFSEDGVFSVNGIPAHVDPAVTAGVKGAGPGAQAGPDYPYTVPADSFFVLNDCRPEAGDSRSFGAVKLKDMRGEAFWLFRRRGF